MARAKDDHAPLLNYLDELVEDLHKNVNKALRDFDSDGIHDARVATRRLKAAMELLQPVLSDQHRKPFEKVLKKLRRRLGPLRDLDVMIGNLSEIKSEAGLGPAATYMKEHLSRRQQDERDRTRKKTSPAGFLSKLGCWYPVREEIVESAQAVDSLLSQSLHLKFDAFAEQAAQLGNDPAAHRNDPHQLRIAGKSLRYTLEMAKEQGHKLPGSILKVFKKMQDALGDWHDDVVMVQCAMSMSLEKMLAYHQPGMQDQMLKLARFFLAKSERELAGFAKLWQQHGEQIAAAIRQHFPLTQPASPPATGPQTGPGPAGSIDTPAPEAPAPDAPSNA
jgi:CHAD domain-containing protein